MLLQQITRVHYNTDTGKCNDGISECFNTIYELLQAFMYTPIIIATDKVGIGLINNIWQSEV